MEIGHLGTGSFQYSSKLEETSEHRRKDTHRKVEKVTGGVSSIVTAKGLHRKVCGFECCGSLTN